MDAVTTNTRDGWEEHFQRGSDLLEDACEQFARAQRHLEPLQKDRVGRFCVKVERVIRRSGVVRAGVIEARLKLAAYEADRTPS